MKESRLVRNIVQSVQRRFPNAFVVKLNDKTTRGLPDLLIVVEHLHLFVETKVGSNQLSPIQQAVHRQIHRAGGIVLTAREVQEVLFFLEKGLQATTEGNLPYIR
jgi:hypothetical protein